LESGIKIPFEIDVESVPIDVQMEQLFLIVEAHIPGGINKSPGGSSAYYAL